MLTVWQSGKVLTRNDCFLGKLEFEYLKTTSTDTEQWYQLTEDTALAPKGTTLPIRGSILLRIGPFVTEVLLICSFAPLFFSLILPLAPSHDSDFAGNDGGIYQVYRHYPYEHHAKL